jgi:hypothetical protein
MRFLERYFPMLPKSGYMHGAKLNSYEPAMTQLSRMCLCATVSQYVSHKLLRIKQLIAAYGEEATADYIWSHYAYAMAHFMQYKVIGKDYNRNFSFWQNVLSSVRSVHNYVDSRYKRRYGCGLSSLNDMLGDEKGSVERMATLSSKDKPVPLSYGSRRKSDDELMTVLEDKEEMECGFYS